MSDQSKPDIESQANSESSTSSGQELASELKDLSATTETISANDLAQALEQNSSRTEKQAALQALRHGISRIDELLGEETDSDTAFITLLDTIEQELGQSSTTYFGDETSQSVISRLTKAVQQSRQTTQANRPQALETANQTWSEAKTGASISASNESPTQVEILTMRDQISDGLTSVTSSLSIAETNATATRQQFTQQIEQLMAFEHDMPRALYEFCQKIVGTMAQLDEQLSHNFIDRQRVFDAWRNFIADQLGTLQQLTAH